MYRHIAVHCAIIVIVATCGASALDVPLYGIISDGESLVPTDDDVNTVASMFWMTQGSFGNDPGILRQANSSFRPIRYVPTWASQDMQAIEASPLRSDTLGYQAGSLVTGLSANTSTFAISLAATKFRSPAFLASAPSSGDVSTSCSDFVSWLRIDDELAKVMAVSAVDTSTRSFNVTVARGFSNTTATRHILGATVLAPVYNSVMPPGSPQCVSSGGNSPISYQINPVGLGRTGVSVLIEQAILSVQHLNYSGVWFDCFAATAFEAVTGAGDHIFTSSTPGDASSVWDVSSPTPVPFWTGTYHQAEAERLAAVQAALEPVLGRPNEDYFIYANNLQANKYRDADGGDARFLMPGQQVPAWPGNNTLVPYEPLAGYCNEAYGLYETGDCHFAVPFHQPRDTIVANMLMVSNLSAQELRSMPMAAQAGCKSPALERLPLAERDLLEQFAYGTYLMAVASSLDGGETTAFGLPVLYWRNSTDPNGTVTTQKFAHVHERYSYGLGDPEWPVAPIANETQWQLWPASHAQLFGRRFSNGLVILNFAESAPALRVALNETLLDPDNAWAPVDTVDIANGTAKLLLRSKP